MSLSFMDNYARIRREKYNPPALKIAPVMVLLPAPLPPPVANAADEQILTLVFEPVQAWLTVSGELIPVQDPPVRDIINLSSKQGKPEADDKKKKIKADDILRKIAKEYQITVAEIKGPYRECYLIEARFKACYEIFVQCEFSLPRIGKIMGKRDHTSILHACRTYKKRMDAGEHNKRLLAGRERFKGNYDKKAFKAVRKRQKLRFAGATA